MCCYGFSLIGLQILSPWNHDFNIADNETNKKKKDYNKGQINSMSFKQIYINE